MTNQQGDVKNEITKQLVESGRYDEISVLLRQQLIESGWIGELKTQIAIKLNNVSPDENIKFSNIMDSLNLEELYNSKMDSEIKSNVMLQLQKFLMENFDVL